MKYEALVKFLESERISISPSETEYIEKFIDIADNFPSVCFMASPEGEIYYFNQKWYDLTESSIYDSIGDRWQHFIHPSDVVDLKEKMQHSVRHKKSLEAEYRLLGKDRKYSWHKLMAVPQKDSDGKVLFFVGTCMDISSQILSSSNTSEKIKSLEVKNKELEGIARDQKYFAEIVCHDLKAPLSNIEAMVEMLGRVTQKNEEAQSLVSMMEFSIKLFKEMLVEMASVKRKTEEDVTCFVDILNEIKFNISQQIRDSGVEINYNFLNAPSVNISKKDLYSILQNIITNAIKYRSIMRTPKISLNSALENDYVVLSITDNGLGMDISQDNIFDKYKRLHSHVEGSGLGLYLVKNILENAGGKIEVYSQLGQGSTFKIFFKS